VVEVGVRVLGHAPHDTDVRHRDVRVEQALAVQVEQQRRTVVAVDATQRGVELLNVGRAFVDEVLEKLFESPARPTSSVLLPDPTEQVPLPHQPRLPRRALGGQLGDPAQVADQAGDLGGRDTRGLHRLDDGAHVVDLLVRHALSEAVQSRGAHFWPTSALSR
jgi:hypothetical protein